LQECLAAQKLKKRWYLDSGYSRHMTGDKDQFITLEMKERGMITFGDNGKRKIIKIGKINITPCTFYKNILLVD